MANLPFNSAAASSAASGGTQRLALDNLIRRELRVADPSDARQVAQALLDRYKADPRAAAIEQEARGLPFLQASAPAPAVVAQPTSSAAEWQQALDDVDADLRSLIADPLVKDVAAELRGWGQAIRSAMAEGYNAARFALDPRNRDKAFGIRRQLNDYARAARLIGALTAGVSQNYRKLAQSLDEAAAVLLVAMGEALANIGFGGGRFLLQAPFSELQVRRDAVIHALRNLVGATQQAFAPNEWPRGIDAYRTIYQQLEAQGQGDLRALLEEGELSRVMDELIQRAAHGNIEGLRALGSTAQIDLARFRRLVTVARQISRPESPPLASFLEALMLFTEAFDASGGIRLLRIARPPMLLYGLYGMQRLQRADERLLLLIQTRGVFAGQLDCFTACACDQEHQLCQIVLDKVLYDLDRAIDLYALGSADLGSPECRASAYGFVVDAALLHCLRLRPGPMPPRVQIDRGNTGLCDLQAWPGLPTELVDIGRSLRDIRGLLRPLPNDPQLRHWDTSPATYAQRCLPLRRHQELCIQRNAEARLTELVATMAPGCIRDAAVFGAGQGVLEILMRRAINLSATNLYLARTTDNGADLQVALEAADGSTTPEVQVLQRFVRQIDPDGTGPVPETLCALVDWDTPCEPDDLTIPPHYETSLDSLANDVDSAGFGRQVRPSVLR